MHYITPETAKKLGDSRSLEELRRQAQSNAKCESCGKPVWKYGGCGLCFQCTTGESDSSSEYELWDSIAKAPAAKEQRP